MTNHEVIKTIREALEKLSALKGSWDGERYSLEESDVWHLSRLALTALDSLAETSKQEPSEDAREFVRQILTSYGNFCMKSSGYDYVAMFNESSITEASAFITARDERIRRECADRIKTLKAEYTGKKVSDYNSGKEFAFDEAIFTIKGGTKK